MKRVLCIISSLNAGGAETFLMKIYRSLETNKYQMDFAVSELGGVYEKEVKERGGKIHFVHMRTQKPVKSFSELYSLVKKEKYQYVLKLCDTPIGVTDVIAAKLAGAKRVAVRSCNANCNEVRLRKAVNGILRPILNTVTDVKIAPSDLAADFTFGHKQVQKNKISFLHNAVDLDVYKFDPNSREDLRKEIAPNNELVIGHIGRFTAQKNHSFLLKIFKEIKKIRKDSILVLVGTGDLKSEIQENAKELQIDDSVVFTGVRSDIPQLLSAMDVFVLPSFFEGMPNTVIEAQAVGLPCVISDTITKQANITDLVKYLPLEKAPDFWAKNILSSVCETRKNTKKDFILNKYDILSVREEFVKLIFGEE